MTAGGAGVRVVAAGAAHARVLARLHAAAFTNPWTDTAFGCLLAQPNVIALIAVADSGDANPLGMILARVAAGDAEVLTMGVVPEARRRGVAGQLLKAALEAVRTLGGERMSLEVAADNTPARRLYAACGFTPVGSRPEYYGKPEGRRGDALILSLTLT